jgi:predicted transcriptional regulator
MSVIIPKQVLEHIEHTLVQLDKTDVCISVIHTTGDISAYNNDEMREQMVVWKDLAKQGKLVVRECNNQTRQIKGKDHYLLTIQPVPNDTNMDPIGLALDFMVSGYIYLFKKEVNRDSVFNYIKKFCK